VVLFAFTAAFPPLNDAAEVNLAGHMAQHVLIGTAGAIVAYPLVSGRKGTGKLMKVSGLVLVVLSSALAVVWRLPASWDAAILSPLVHALEHLSFFAIGGMVGAAIPAVTQTVRIVWFTLFVVAHTAYGYFLLSVGAPIYLLSSTSDQAFLGYAMVLTGMAAVFPGLYYLVRASPGNRSFSNVSTWVSVLRAPRPHPARWLLPPALSLGLTLAFAGYIVIALTSAASAPTPAHVPTVYIEEGFTYWQYSPQDITVVLGVNSTVTWVSHSLAFDTVTFLDGRGSSGWIRPGETFNRDFTAPGTFDYYCVFHSWMRGTVRVLPVP